MKDSCPERHLDRTNPSFDSAWAVRKIHDAPCASSAQEKTWIDFGNKWWLGLNPRHGAVRVVDRSRPDPPPLMLKLLPVQPQQRHYAPSQPSKTLALPYPIPL